MEPFLIAVIVFFLAILFSIIGTGGSTIYVPLLYWIGIDLHIIIPTVLLINTFATGSATISYTKKRMVDFKTAIPLILTSVVGAPVGAYFSKSTPQDLLILIFAVFLLLIGIHMVFTSYRIGHLKCTGRGTRKNVIIGLISGFMIGIVAGLLGLSGGVFIVPLLVYLGYNIKTASATSLFIIVFTSISGFLGHIGTNIGSLDAGLLVYSSLAGFLGAQVGSYFMIYRLKSKTINQMFGIVLWVVAIRLIIGFI
ncbi:sulfite exporter TauE/SafE family protein [Methanohalobium sp.]|uniref:sulfite exporter TauE/SafE family protein n=1 Tax=Methanohalobium sp. TaxID=2837493 RepID=UPI0025D648DD|nr:sulfite exporter TauE/SafE family protein [Methanohalobium sp.]